MSLKCTMSRKKWSISSIFQGKNFFSRSPNSGRKSSPWIAGLGLTASIRATASCRAWQASEHFSPDPSEHNQEVVWVLRDVASSHSHSKPSFCWLFLEGVLGRELSVLLLQTHNKDERGFENEWCCAAVGSSHTCWVFMQLQKEIYCTYMFSVYVQSRLTKVII